MRKMFRSLARADEPQGPEETPPHETLHDEEDLFPDEDDASYDKVHENDEKKALDDDFHTDFDDDFDIDDADNLSLDGLDDGADGPTNEMPPPYLSGPNTAVVGDVKRPLERLDAPLPAPAPAPAPVPPATTPAPPAPLAASRDEPRLIDLDDEEGATLVNPVFPPAPPVVTAAAPAPRTRLFPLSNSQPPRSSAATEPRSGAQGNTTSDLIVELEALSLNNNGKQNQGNSNDRRQHGARLFPPQPRSTAFGQLSRPSASEGGSNAFNQVDDDLDDWLSPGPTLSRVDDDVQPPRTTRQARFLDDTAIPSATTSATRGFRAQSGIFPEYDLASSAPSTRGRSSSVTLPPYSRFPEGGPADRPFSRPAAAAQGRGQAGRGRGRVRMCTVCHIRPAYQSNGKSYPTCGLNCAAALHRNNGRPPRQNNNGHNFDNTIQNPFLGAGEAIRSYFSSRSTSAPPPESPKLASEDFKGYKGYGRLPCVICMRRPALSAQIPTCSPECAERLCAGDADPRLCDYCHRRPKIQGYDQCGRTCGQLARNACLLCKSRPKFKQYHLCGKTCREIASKWTPLLLEAPREHETFRLVEKKFNDAWQGGPTEPLPKIRHIYKIVESKAFLRPYDRYKRKHGNEIFAYHGTKRRCKLGSNGNTRLCNDSGCKLCEILKTSFSTRLANPRGSFGAGVYSSTSSNSAHFYTGKGTGAVIVSKVVLGKVYNVTGFNAVNSCPSGYDSVVFNHKNGARNESVVYTDDAIRPVFLIVFQ